MSEEFKIEASQKRMSLEELKQIFNKHMAISRQQAKVKEAQQ